MKQVPIENIEGVYLSSRERYVDQRGVFERFSSIDSKNYLENTYICFSHNHTTGTVRGFHLQSAPKQESKFVTCIKGSIFDVLLDLRSDSQTFLNWASILLTENGGEIIYIPKGIAHAFQVLEDNTLVAYLIQGEYNKSMDISISVMDSSLDIRWPLKISLMSNRDLNAMTLEGFLKLNQ